MSRPLLLVTSAATLLFLAACSVEPKPTKADIERSLNERLPDFVRLSSLTIEAMENMGTKVEPIWHARFRATIRLTARTFVPDGAGADVQFLRPMREESSSIELFGKSTSQLRAGAWPTSTVIENTPELGQPEGAFSGLRVIVRGTKAESDYMAAEAEKQRVAELQAAEHAAAAQAAQVASRVIGKYTYIAQYTGRIYNQPVAGTITLTDVGIALSGMQGDEDAKPFTKTFFQFFTEQGKRTSLWRANYLGGTWGQKDYRVVWEPFWPDYRSPLRFANERERDRFWVDLTEALGQWNSKYSLLATEFEVRDLCEVNTRFYPCSMGFSQGR